MNIPRSQGTLFSLLGLAFLLGIGSASAVYWILVAPTSNDQLADDGAKSPSVQASPVNYEKSTRKNVASAATPEKIVLQDLDDLDQIKSSFERGLALRNLLSNSDEAQVADFLTQSQDLFSNNQRYSIQNVVIRRLAQLNPKRALRHLREMKERHYPGQFVGIVYQEWVHSNLDEAIAHARTLEDDWKDSALRVIVQERKDLSAEVLKSIARDLGNEQIAVTAIAHQKLEDAIGDPERAWSELAVDMQDDRENIWVILRVASTWVEQSGLSVLDQIDQSLTNSETRQWVLRNVLEDVAAAEPVEAFRFALKIENDQYNMIISNVVRMWARSDPRSAITAASEIEKRSLRREMEEQVVNTWASEKPREVLDGIDALPEHLHATAMSRALGEIARESPEEAVGVVVSLESGPARMSAAMSVTQNWAYQDPEAALDWILNEPSIEDLRRQLLSRILYSIVRTNPELAMSAALSQPIEEGENGQWGNVGLEATVISNLAYSDLDKAIELLPQVRKGQTKLQTYQMVSGALIRNGDIEEALAMAQQFPESDRNEFYIAVAGAWAQSDPEGLLNSMNRLPTKEAKSSAAMSLITYNHYQKTLTEEQIEDVRKFLTDEDAKALEEGEAHMLRGF